MSPHDEDHSSHRIGLLRAMVLGANDGIISTACLVLGVAAATAERSTILTAGMAGLVAGAAGALSEVYGDLLRGAGAASKPPSHKRSISQS